MADYDIGWGVRLERYEHSWRLLREPNNCLWLNADMRRKLMAALTEIEAQVTSYVDLTDQHAVRKRACELTGTPPTDGGNLWDAYTFNLVRDLIREIDMRRHEIGTLKTTQARQED